MEDPKHPLNPFARNKPGEWRAPEDNGFDRGRIAGLKEALEQAEEVLLRLWLRERIAELEQDSNV